MSALAPSNSTALSPTGPFMNPVAFNQLWRVSQAFAASGLVPATYRGKPESCFVALDLADRLGVHPLMLMQNTFEVGGRPSFSIEFLTALASARGVFTGPILFREEGEGASLAVTAYATLARGGAVVEARVTMAEARADGWTRNTKYQSIPGQMLRKRAAGRLIGLYAPEVKFGFPTLEEEEDRVFEAQFVEVPTPAAAAPQPAAGDVIHDPRQVDVEEVTSPAPQAAPPPPAAAPEPSPASAPTAAAEETRFAVLDAHGEEVATYARAGAAAQKRLQEEIAKARDEGQLSALLEHNADLVASMAIGSQGNIANSAADRRAAWEAAASTGPEAAPAAEPPAAADETPQPEPQPEAPAAGGLAPMDIPRRPDRSVDLAALFASMRKAVAGFEALDALEAWANANREHGFAVLRDEVPSWAKKLVDELNAKRTALAA